MTTTAPEVMHTLAVPLEETGVIASNSSQDQPDDYVLAGKCSYSLTSLHSVANDADMTLDDRTEWNCSSKGTSNTQTQYTNKPIYGPVRFMGRVVEQMLE